LFSESISSLVLPFSSSLLSNRPTLLMYLCLVCLRSLRGVLVLTIHYNTCVAISLA
jgi:hypothetical protein